MIATLGPCIPHDLLEATGRHAGALPWRLDRATPQADQWLESKFPAWARSIVEDWVEGRFDDLEAVVFSRGDDAAQRLYYYICELQRRGLVAGPRLTILDVAKIPRATSEAHTVASVRRLAAEFGLDEGALEAGIAATNARRAAMPVAQPAGPACVIVGTPPPQRSLHEAIEGAGFTAIGETLADAWADLGPEVEASSADPAAAIGRQVHRRPNDRRGFGDLVQDTLDLARRWNAAAVVLWYTEEDEARIWELPRIRDALASARLPLLVMTRRDETARDGAPDEILTFLKGLPS